MVATIPRRLRVLCLTGALVLWLTAMAWSPAAANVKKAELEQKIADIALLQNQLGDRMQQSQAILDALNEQQNLLTGEIQVLVRSLNIKTLAQARDHLRLRNNLELLRMIHAYMDGLDAKLGFYQSGRERLGYLRKLAEDDIRMIATLSDLKIDALTTQISLMITRYLSEAHVIQIDPQDVPLTSLEQAWKRSTGLK
jgi:hypothetical protein